VETRKADLVANMFKLTIKAGTLYHYDVTFERKRKEDRRRREDSARREEPGVVVLPVCACCCARHDLFQAAQWAAACLQPC
jgi:hypothetical protein